MLDVCDLYNRSHLSESNTATLYGSRELKKRLTRFPPPLPPRLKSSGPCKAIHIRVQLTLHAIASPVLPLWKGYFGGQVDSTSIMEISDRPVSTRCIIPKTIHCRHWCPPNPGNGPCTGIKDGRPATQIVGVGGFYSDPRNRDGLARVWTVL